MKVFFLFQSQGNVILLVQSQLSKNKIHDAVDVADISKGKEETINVVGPLQPL